mmetsp:Transcript_16705/g.40729  ORF Transcript_16705/g.40729 Transcript_16705/m.40729 type:complete len:303 (+) Transcript_16705:1836-2744(+)
MVAFARRKSTASIYNGHGTATIISILDCRLGRSHTIKHDFGNRFGIFGLTGPPTAHESFGTVALVVGFLQRRFRSYTRCIGGTIALGTRIGGTFKVFTTCTAIGRRTRGWTTAVGRSCRDTGTLATGSVGKFPARSFLLVQPIPEFVIGCRWILVISISGTDTLIRSNGIDTHGRSRTQMTHWMFGWQCTFVCIQNGKGNMKALRSHFSSILFLVNNFESLRSYSRGKTSHGTLDNVLSHSSVKIGSCPFQIDVHNTVQDAIYFFEHYWKHTGKISRCFLLCIRQSCLESLTRPGCYDCRRR